MPVISRNLIILVLCVVLAGCGGNATDNVPEATAEPTLTTEERIAFIPGTVENPLQMVIKPVQGVLVELQTILAELTEMPAETIKRDFRLREDLGLDDNLSTLSEPITESFTTTLSDAQTLLTVGDVEYFVQAQLAEQVAQILFDETGIYFEVPIVDNYGSGLDALCASNLGVVAISWLDGITSVSTLDRGCGEPALQVAMIDGGYDVGLLANIALEDLLPEATPEINVEVTPESTVEAAEDTVTNTPTATAVPTDTPTPEPTETPIAESTPEVTPEPILQDGFGRTGTPVVFLVHRALGTTRVDVVRGRTYCRVSIDDYYSWLVATLIMRQNNIDPQSDLLALLDFPEETALVRAVAEGRCTATSLSEDTFIALQDILDEDVLDGVIVAETTVDYPYAIMMYPFEVELGVRLTLNEILTDLSTDDENGSALRWLLGHDVITPFTQDSFAGFNAYLQTTGLDFGQLGN